MSRLSVLLPTALAPAVWGSTYIVTTEGLPDGYPMTVALIRALPAGLLLLALVRKLPDRRWLLRSFVLGALNFSIFWALLFVAAYRLPGGIAATLGAVQPLIVVFLAGALIGSAVRSISILAAIAGIVGVGLLVLRNHVALDPIGIVAALGGALSMAFGTVLTRKWQPPVSPLVVAAWQLTAGGLLLLPITLWLEPALPSLSLTNLAGFGYLVIFTALTYVLWFRGVSRLEPAAVSSLGFLSPLTAVILGWVILGESLSPLQMVGAGVVLVSVWMSQQAMPHRTGEASPTPGKASAA